MCVGAPPNSPDGEGPQRTNPAFRRHRLFSEPSKKLNKRNNVDVVVVVFIKDLEYRPPPTGEGDGG